MEHYVRISLETHLFFARIMKEHALFLQAGFVKKDEEWIRRADYFRRQFEELLRDTVQMSNRMVSESFLNSGEMVTKYTMDTEAKTTDLSGIPIDRRITAAQMHMECGLNYKADKDDVRVIHKLNERAVWLLNGLIEFKERLLCEVKECRMFTGNYPLLIEHITREAKLYREIIEGMMKNQKVCFHQLQHQEDFWNCIMMEHALFIRGLLDPCEGELINMADDFARDFHELIEEARKKERHMHDARKADCCEKDVCAWDEAAFTKKTLKKTCELRDFKATGTEGILNCQIKSIILPLLTDHVLREANHYIRILEHGYMWQEA